jgi:ATP:ADP antiporter, AAA family
VSLRRNHAELVVALWGALAFGALMTAYSALRPVRDALALDGDPEKIPWLFTATFVAMVVVSPVWSAVLVRGDRRRLVPAAFHAFAGCGAVFAALIAADVEPIVIGRVFYVWSSVFNLFLVSVFWSLLSDLLGPGIAKWLYGPIAAGGTLGSFLGPAVTRVLVGTIGVEGLMIVSIVLLELTVVAIAQVRRTGERLERRVEPVPPARSAPPALGGALDGIAAVMRSPYLIALGAYVLCTATAATFMYMEQAQLTKALLPDRTARTEVFATIDLWVAGISVGLQTIASGPLLRFVGPGVVLCALPLSQAVGITTIELAPSLTALIAVQVASRSATHGLTRPARELLFTVISPDDKYRAKNTIDTIVYRFGDLGSVWLYQGLGVLGVALTTATAPLIAIWLALAAALGVGFRHRHTPPVGVPSKELP